MENAVTRRNFVAGAALSGLAAAGLAPMIAKASENSIPESWDYEYDIVVCGAGASGLLAALKANDAGCKVLCIDANYDIGGHAAVCGGITHSGGGTQLQKDSGVEDTPDQYYLDHTDPGFINTRFNDRAILREVADRMAECFDWMLTKGLSFPEGTTVTNGMGDEADSVPRSAVCDASAYVKIDTGLQDSGKSGIGLTRPFEETGLVEGVDFMMNRHMDSLVIDDSGRVVGVRASYNPRTLPDGTELVALHADQHIQDTTEELAIKANKAVIIATGGGTGNVAWRTMFDPRWTQEYDGVAGEPYSFQDASGEIAGMAIGAGLGDTANWTVQAASPITTNKNIGVRYGYQNLPWGPESDVFPLAGGTGLRLVDVDGIIYVNMLGDRFHDENMSVKGDDAQTYDFYADAMGSVIIATDKGTERVGGPIWAIFGAEAVEDNDWNCDYPDVDIENGYFFSADTLEDLAATIVNKYFEDVPMDPEKLAAAVQSYNDAVDAGEETAFGRDPETMTLKIENGPFCAAWATPILHDCLTGLRTNAHRQVLRVDGTPIEGLWACGECAGGHHVHGIGKVQTAGYIAGMYAAQEG